MQKKGETDREVPRLIEELRARLEEAEEILRALRGGEVDALVVSGPHGDQVYTLRGAEHPYRVIVEAMNEGAATLTADGTLFYSNRSFAEMLKMPLEEVIGSTMSRFLLAEDQPVYEMLIRRGQEGSSKGEVRLRAKDGSVVPVYLSISSLELGATRNVCVVVTDLTGHKYNQELLASQALERTIRAEAEAGRQRMANILESITDAFFSVDREWRITDVNQRAAAIYGQTREELIGKVFWNTFPQNRLTEFDNQYHKAMAERVPVHFEALSRIAEGSWLEMHVYPTEEGLAVYFRDITARKQSEACLAYQANLLANVHDAILATDDQLNLTAWNRAAEETYGWKAKEVLGRKVEDVLRSEFTDAQRSEALKTLAETGHYYVEVAQYSRDGRRLWMQGHTTALRDEAGRITGYVGVNRDITERKQAEEELRRSEAHLAEAQRIGHIGSWTWNVSSGDLFWSLEHFRIFGLDPENFKPTKETTQRLIHPEDLPRVEQTIARAVRERSDFEVDYRIVRPDGAIRYHRDLGHPVVKESGELTEYAGMVMDFTERKRAEEALRAAQAELAHVTRVTTLGELTASIAHEINQPLGAIVTNGQTCLRLLSRPTPDLAGTREAIECMISDGLRASEVIQRIRALLKKAATKKVWLNINETIQEVIALAASELVKNQVLLRTDLKAGLPLVLGDRIQLQQVVLNLILNSNEAMSGEGCQPRELLITSQESKPDEVMVTVRDSGTGFDSQNGERIFDSFFTTKEGGLGLGLSISRTIVEAHGGRLWATPNKGQGTTLQFTLPTSGESKS